MLENVIGSDAETSQGISLVEELELEDPKAVLHFKAREVWEIVMENLEKFFNSETGMVEPRVVMKGAASARRRKVALKYLGSSTKTSTPLSNCDARRLSDSHAGPSSRGVQQTPELKEGS